MTNSPNSEMQLSNISGNTSPRLTVDFFESGIGETIIITFPDGGIGVVDAHPSQDPERPSISDLTKGKKIHFLCMTHPHADHGKDLVPLLERHPEIRAFWHTVSDISAFIFAEGGQVINYRSPFHEAATELQADWGRWLTKIYGNVAERNIPHHKLRSDLEAKDISGVKVHVLSPEEQEQNRSSSAYHQMASGKRSGMPDPNALSAILVLEYAGSTIVLGADALKKNWKPAIKKYRRLGLQKASVLKVPHHGASNAIDLRKKQESYLDLCSGSTLSILFAGDSNHPDRRVHQKLSEKTSPACLINGTRDSDAANTKNPLEIFLPGAKAVTQAISPCQRQVSVQICEDGDFTLIQGKTCQECPLS